MQRISTNYGKLLLLLASICAVAPNVIAQDKKASQYIADGDKATKTRKGEEALKAYEEAIRVDSMNLEALWKATTTAVALAEFGGQTTVPQRVLVSNAERYAKRAYEKDSTKAESQFVLAQAYGRAALLGGQMARLKYSTTIYGLAAQCLKIEPKHAGCAHILGNWHAEVMRLSTFERSMARSMTQSPLFDEASWDKAAGYLEAAVKVSPKRAVHHFVLAQIYSGMGNKEKAIAQYKAVEAAPLTDFNDERYKTSAEIELKKLQAGK